LAFSNSFLRAVLKLRPERLMNICTIRIADPKPPGDTFLVAMMRATSSPGLVKVPGGGKVEIVLMLWDHLRFGVLRLATVLLLLDFMDELGLGIYRPTEGDFQHPLYALSASIEHKLSDLIQSTRPIEKNRGIPSA
jgi:hypothetical protein